MSARQSASRALTACGPVSRPTQKASTPAAAAGRACPGCSRFVAVEPCAQSGLRLHLDVVVPAPRLRSVMSRARAMSVWLPVVRARQPALVRRELVRGRISRCGLTMHLDPGRVGLGHDSGRSRGSRAGRRGLDQSGDRPPRAAAGPQVWIEIQPTRARAGRRTKPPRSPRPAFDPPGHAAAEARRHGTRGGARRRSRRRHPLAARDAASGPEGGGALGLVARRQGQERRDRGGAPQGAQNARGLEPRAGGRGGGGPRSGRSPPRNAPPLAPWPGARRRGGDRRRFPAADPAWRRRKRAGRDRPCREARSSHRREPPRAGGDASAPRGCRGWRRASAVRRRALPRREPEPNSAIRGWPRGSPSPPGPGRSSAWGDGTLDTRRGRPTQLPPRSPRHERNEAARRRARLGRRPALPGPGRIGRDPPRRRRERRSQPGSGPGPGPRRLHGDDVVHILTKGREQPGALRAHLEADRALGEPKSISRGAPAISPSPATCPRRRSSGPSSSRGRSTSRSGTRCARTSPSDGVHGPPRLIRRATPGLDRCPAPANLGTLLA